MLPRLMAEDALVMTKAVAVGNGTLEGDEGKKILKAWEEQAGIKRSIRPLSKDKTEAALAVMGIEVCPAKS